MTLHSSTSDAKGNTEVLIVGAGPTGLLLANLLGGMGVQVLLVERNEGTVDEPRAVSIDDESMRALQAAGLASKVEAITARGYGSIYRGPDGRPFAQVMPIAREFGFHKRNAFQQPELESILRDGLARFANVEARFGCELQRFEQDATGVRATLCQDGSQVGLRARFLVACDGGRSSARKALEIRMEGSTFEQPWLIVDLARSENRNRHTEVLCDPVRPCISLPGPGGIRRYEFMLRRDEHPEAMASESVVRDLLASVGPDRDAEIRRRQVYTFHARIAERWRSGHVLLAGDAAHLTPPFAGQGMNSGLRDAHNLAWKLHEALTADIENDGVAVERLLESYGVERKPHAWAMIELALRMGQIMMPASRVRGAVVRAGFRALGIWPPARDYVAQMRYKPKPRFKAGLIWPDGRAVGRTAIGRMLPQPEVENAARIRMLLDEALPDAPVILIFDESPEAALPQMARAALQAAGVDVVGIVPEWRNPAADAPFPILRDAGRLLSEEPFRSYLGQALLLRRDRYLAAARPTAEVLKLLDPLRALSPVRADVRDVGHTAADRPTPGQEKETPEEETTYVRPIDRRSHPHGADAGRPRIRA